MADENDLLDSVETTYSIECVACGLRGDSDALSPLDAAKEFTSKDWARHEDGEVQCPECRRLEGS